MVNVRSGVKGIVVVNNRLLTIKRSDKKFNAEYSLPGGVQQYGEHLIEALKRNFLEEVGCHIEVKQFAILREYIGANHTGSSLSGSHTHVIDHMFLCEILDEQNIGSGTGPDEDALEIEWISLKYIEEFRFFPRELIPYIIDMAKGHHPHGIYIRDIN
ncbi:NUDIX domain-containing protein [Cohnella soli]|uniref:NUDIX domain-containing protein n=1 Tax=Cohnella soli TaxID=425005 RepID=A0ABW0I1V8_9BACL